MPDQHIFLSAKEQRQEEEKKNKAKANKRRQRSESSDAASGLAATGLLGEQEVQMVFMW